MRKFIALLCLLWCGAAYAQHENSVQFSQDKSGATKNVYVWDSGQWVTIGNFNPTTHVWQATGTAAFTSGTVGGNTIGVTNGTLTNGDCVSIDSSHRLVDAGAPCGTGTGSGTVTAGNTNQLSYYSSNAATVVGLTLNSSSTKEYLSQTSSGTPTYAQVAFGDISGSATAGQVPNISSLNGSLGCSQTPALTGNVTTSAGSCGTTIGSGVITNSMITANTITNSSLASGVAVANLGYTPVSKNGDTMTGDLTIAFPSSNNSSLTLNAPTGFSPISLFQINGVSQAQFYSNSSFQLVGQDLVTGSTPSFLTLTGGNLSLGESAHTIALQGTSFTAPAGTLSGNLTVAPFASQATVIINSPTGNSAVAEFEVNSTLQSYIYANTTDPFVAQDNVNGAPILFVTAAGNLTLGEASHTVAIANITGVAAQCLQANSSGVVSGTGAACPTGGSVSGPVSSTSGNVALWNNSSGTLLKDGGYVPVNKAGDTLTGTLNTLSLASNPGVLTGASANAYWQFAMSDSYAVGAGNFSIPFTLQEIMASGGNGSRNALNVNMVTGYGQNGQNYVGAQFNSYLCGTSTADLCSGQNGAGSGHAFGINTVVVSRVGTGTDTEIVGYESDVAALSSTNLSRKVGIQIISVTADAGHASNSSLDTALLIDSSGAAFNSGIVIGAQGQGVATGGTLFATGTGTYQNGVYLNNATIVGNAFSSNGFLVNGSGNLSATLANTATTSAVCYNTSTRLFTYDGTLGTCNTSDERLKTFDRPIVGALDRLIALSHEDHFGYFHGQGEGVAQFGDKEHIGVGAQTLAKYFPELVEKGSTGLYSAGYAQLTIPIVSALSELEQRVERLEGKK